MYNFFIPLIVFIFGVVIGSFLNVLIYRIPKGENIAYPSSHCQNCKTPLKWWHNIPIISWVILKGECYYCKEKISIQYPIIEFITGVIAILVYYKLGLVWYMPIVFLVFAMLLVLIVIDIEYLAIPDSINLLALTLAFIQPNFLEAFQNALMAMGGLALLRFYLSYLLKKEAMGEGDIIVAGTMGALLGFPLFFYALFLSAILAIIPSLISKDKMVPFVPFLAIATFIVYIGDKWFYKLGEWIIY
jgi:leader peptidase (prepilin peptidase)/N-methyltransferase